MGFLILYAACIGLTLIVEIGVAAAMTPKPLRRPVVATVALLNLFTHPLAFIAVATDAPARIHHMLRGRSHWNPYYDAEPLLTWIVVETAVVAVEATGLRTVLGLSRGRAAATSVACNVASAFVGMALWAWLSTIMIEGPYLGPASRGEFGPVFK